MTGQRQKNQQPRQLSLPGSPSVHGHGEQQGRVEPAKAKTDPESQVASDRLMEEVCERKNLLRALKRVKSNKGAPGIDGMTVRELSPYLMRSWRELREQLLTGTYEPKPVKRVEIPKPAGGVRKLGIPCAVDRFIQQAVLQVLQDRWDGTFSPHSYGFRPGRSAHQAIAQAQQYVAEGYTYSVDLDLEKFFDRVNHDMLMARVAQRITDKRVLRLIRSFLNAGIMVDGLVSASSDEGMPQGGPLSPLLSNLFLDELDRELENRGHRFVRYADDCNVYVKSERSGQRVLEGIKKFLGKKLKLRVNEKKSKVSRVNQSKFLGFSIWVPRNGGYPKRFISRSSLKCFRQRVRSMTRRRSGQSLEHMIETLNKYLQGWKAYYGFGQWRNDLKDLDAWIRRRLRCYIWSRWKKFGRRYKALRALGLPKSEAQNLAGAGSNYGPWRISLTMALHIALPNKFFKELGLVQLYET